MTNVSGGKKRLSAKQWWSQAWWEALSKRAVHDANRLPRGRTYARNGAVEIDSVSVGIVEASVAGSRPLPYATNLFLKTYNQESLEVMIQIMGSRVEFLAALLGGEVPIELEHELTLEEVPLLPSSGELSFSCSCPDWADPCKHAAALCYAFSEELEADPFQLLLLRGIEKETLLDRLRNIRSKGASATPIDHDPSDNHVPLSNFEAKITSSEINLDWLTDLVSRCSEGATDNSEISAPLTPHKIYTERPNVDLILSYASIRATELLDTGKDPGLNTRPEVNLARFAQAFPNAAEISGSSEGQFDFGGDMRTLITAYDLATDEGVETLLTGARLDKKSTALAQNAFTNFYLQVSSLAAERKPEIVASTNAVTCGNLQLRRSDRGNWFLFCRDRAGWELVGGPEPAVEDLFAEVDME